MVDYLVKDSKSIKTVYRLDDNDIIISTAQDEIAKSIKNISGAEIVVKSINRLDLSGIKNGVILAKFTDVENLTEKQKSDSQTLMGTDGFSVRETNGNIYILSHCSSGVFYGAFDFLEKNADIIWYRGKEDSNQAFTFSKDIIISNKDYVENPFSKLRGWNMCGIGAQGSHLDIDSIKYYAKNKLNAKLGSYDDEYSNYGLQAFHRVCKGTHDLSKFFESNPELFMLEDDGKPRKNYGSYSFLNYYNPQTAKLFAQNLIDYIDANPSVVNSNIHLDIPDDNFFEMYKNGEKISDKPFTTDQGVTVYPQDRAYKSTVYYNFLNRVIAIVCEKYPSVRFSTLAYLYAEQCPKVKVDQRNIIVVCPICANERLAYHQATSSADLYALNNIKEWLKTGNEIALYAYWGCSPHKKYPRPICKVVRDNLIHLKDLGLTSYVPEGILDGASRNDLDNPWSNFDMDGIFIWIMTRLMWNPYEDIDALMDKFCRLVYGDAHLEMYEFYQLIQRGWDSKEAYVFCATGVDTYYRQFIINAGIDEQVVSALKRASEKNLTPEQKRQIDYIYSVMNKNISDIKSIKDEQARAIYCDIGVEKILSSEQLAVEENLNSVWNKTEKLISFYNYSTFEPVDQRAKLNVRLLYDKDYIYVGFQVFDDLLTDAEIVYNEYNQPTVYRADGSKMDSYTETYMGGNILNMSEYYGFITGVFKKTMDIGFYKNNGAPFRIERSSEFKEGFYFHYDENPEKRYYFHVQAIPFKALDVKREDARPYGSFVYYTDRYGRVGWKGNGLWAKQGFTEFELVDIKEKK